MKRSPLNRKGGDSLKRTPLAKGSSALAARKPLQRGSSTLSQGDKPLQSRTPLSQGNKPLQSRSSLNPGSKTLKSGSNLQRGSKQLTAKEPMKYKPKSMTAEEKRCREVVKQRSGGTCEICGKRAATDMAHRLAVSQGGKWQPCNILHACRQCHSDNHDHPQNSFDHGWHLRSGSEPSGCKVLLSVAPHRQEWFFLDDNGGKTSQFE